MQADEFFLFVSAKREILRKTSVVGYVSQSVEGEEKIGTKRKK